jgi:hypothetical protein
LSQSQVPWQASLMAFAFVRLLTVLPVTPGGAGITELGLVSILAAGADHKVVGQVTAAVLLSRAVTYLVPIPSGALACVAWRYTSAGGRSPRRRTGYAARGLRWPRGQCWRMWGQPQQYEAAGRVYGTLDEHPARED